MGQNENTQPKKDEEMTGSDIPGGDGTVSDEDVNAIDGDHAGSPPADGQDHSTENYEDSMPDAGVGGVQDSNQAGSDIADISE